MRWRNSCNSCNIKTSHEKINISKVIKKYFGKMKKDEIILKALIKLWDREKAPLNEIAEFIIEEGVKLTDSKFGFLVFFDEDEKTASMIAWSKNTLKECSLNIPPHLPVEKGNLWAECIQQRKPIIVNEYVGKKYPPGHVEIIKFIILPICEDNRLIAVAGVANKPRDYTQDDVNRLMLLMQVMCKVIWHKEKEEKYRTIVEQSKDAIFIYRGNRLLFANNKACEITGYSKEELYNMNIFDLIHPEDKEGVKEIARKKTKGKKAPANYEARIITKNGEVKCCEFSVKRIIYGGKYAALGVVRDISERKEMEQILIEAEARYRNLFERVPLGVYRSSPSGKILEYNPALIEMLGYSSGKPLLEVNVADLHVNPEDWRRWKKILEEQGVVKDYETRLKRYDGKIIWVRNNARVVRDKNGRVLYYEGSLEDITERKTVEERLKKILNRMQAGVVIIDANTHEIIDANPMAIRMIGLPKHEIIGKLCHEFICPAERGKCPISDLGQKIDNSERELVNAKGEIVPILKTVATITLPNDKECYIESFVDISKLKEAEESLKKSEEEKTAILNNMEEVMLFQDLNHKIIWANKRAGEVLNVPTEELMGEKCYEVWAKRSKPCPNCVVEKAIKTGKPQTGEEATPDGKIWYKRATPLKDAKGNIIGVLETRLDITERKRVEEELKASLREKEILLKEIHHRVKNNLQIINSLLRLRARSIEDEQILTMFKECQNRIKSIALVHETLYRSKELDKIDFSEYIKGLVNYLFKTYKVDSTMIELDVKAENVFLDINTAVPCGLIITELVSNSLKYAFPNGRKGKVFIELNINLNEEKITMIVGDNGIGLTEEKFNNAKTLGLQLVKDLVSQLGGEIKIEHGKGAVFRISFPIRR